MTTAISQTWSLMVMNTEVVETKGHLLGQGREVTAGCLTQLTFRATPTVVQTWLDDRCIASVDRAAFADWMATRGPRPPLVDIPLHLSWSYNLGVTLEIHGHVAPTLIEKVDVDQLFALAYRSRPQG